MVLTSCVPLQFTTVSPSSSTGVETAAGSQLAVRRGCSIACGNHIGEAMAAATAADEAATAEIALRQDPAGSSEHSYQQSCQRFHEGMVKDIERITPKICAMASIRFH